ncbi:hypothetical protein [Novosphingobium sp. Fuku2-ISO-50]|uniref:hypothetical protein n=1 Tax=Novosphingobium sp. Fuku2-ISO-50 TaxID=1739114 RepID=UPI00076BE519|nr:hypothetical protein [Novosphingobium sp. Fuku2-ISO-50]KUR76699.1 hypothetical protein AQZ50_12540 [Novosphingobium sp. Fuku2-ISO-50]
MSLALLTLATAGEAPMGPPVNPWVMETGSIIFWSVLLAATVLVTLFKRRLPLFGLVLIAATSSFWQEFYGDWGAYDHWNPAFARLPLWGISAYTTPVKPLFIPFSWGWWFALSIPLLVSLTMWLGRRFPVLSTTGWAFVIAFPLFTAYQIQTEGSAVAQGWWSYDVVLGPAIESARGRLPLIFDFTLGLWAATFIAFLARPDADGLRWYERKLGVSAAMAGWHREMRRLVAMIVLFQLTFLAFNTLPPMIGRLLFGGPSALVP